MYSWMKRRFLGKKHALRQAAGTGDASTFCDLLGDIHVVMLAEPDVEGFPANVSKCEILAASEEAASKLSDETQHLPLTYEEDGKTHLPFFLDHESAECFGGAYCRREQRLFQLQALEVPGSVVAQLADHCDELVLNAQCRDQQVLGRDLVSALAQSASA